ncbi:hypothetical protein I4U23_001383 [Adineta vaga]|nr:hypothetical protein I4U23_001383 [Adineta vaga]
MSEDDVWLLYLIKTNSSIYYLDFCVTDVGLLRTLRALCKLSNEIVTNELAVFNNMQFVSVQLLTNITFST